MTQFAWTVVPFDQTLEDEEYKTGMATSPHKILNIPTITASFGYNVSFITSKALKERRDRLESGESQ